MNDCEINKAVAELHYPKATVIVYMGAECLSIYDKHECSHARGQGLRYRTTQYTKHSGGGGSITLYRIPDYCTDARRYMKLVPKLKVHGHLDELIDIWGMSLRGEYPDGFSDFGRRICLLYIKMGKPVEDPYEILLRGVGKLQAPPGA